MTGGRVRLAQILFLSACGLFFCACCLFHLTDTLAFFDDEARKGVYIRNIFSIMRGDENWSFPLLLYCGDELSLPLLMFNPYIGSAFFYAAVPFMFLLPGSALAFKLVPVLSGLLTLLGVWTVMRRHEGAKTAMLCVFLMSVNLPYICFVRAGFIREEVLQAAGLWLGLMFFYLSLSARRKPFLYLAAFVWGFTLWAKMMFAAYILGAGLGLALLGRSRLLSFKRAFFAPSRRAWAFAAAFLLGCGPLVWFNLSTRFVTLRHLLSWVLTPAPAVGLGPGGWNNAAFGANILRRAADLWFYLSGALCGQIADGPLMVFVPVLCVAALCWAVFYAVFRRGPDSDRRAFLRFLLGAYFLVLCLSCLLPARTHTAGHVAIVFPLFEILCAMFLAECARMLRPRGLALFFVCAVSCLWAAEQGAALARARTRLKEEGCGWPLARLEYIAGFAGGRTIVATNGCAWHIKSSRPDARVIVAEAGGPEFETLLTRLRRSEGEDFCLILGPDWKDAALLNALETRKIVLDLEHDLADSSGRMRVFGVRK